MLEMEMKGTKVAVDFGKTVEQKKERGIKAASSIQGTEPVVARRRLQTPADPFRPLENYN